MAVSLYVDEGAAVIEVLGNLTFDSFSEFHEASRSAAYKTVDRHVVDLRTAKYIDSSALGMLLRFKELVGAAHREIEIRITENDVAKVMEISKFDKLFNIELNRPDSPRSAPEYPI